MNHNIFLVLAVICFGIVGYLFFFNPNPRMIEDPITMEEKNIEFENEIEESLPPEAEFDYKGLTIIGDDETGKVCEDVCWETNNTCMRMCNYV